MNDSNQPLLSLKHLEVLLDTPREKLREISENISLHYAPFDTHKKGKPRWRHIDNPDTVLKRIQKKINKYLLTNRSLLLPQEMTGGITGRSINLNASYHIGKECVAVIDINNCFPNISHSKIYKVWINTFNCSTTIASLLTKLTTFERRLPQGAPSSSLLCNFVLLPVFQEIKKIAALNNLDVSIFVDDIIISGSKKNVTHSIQSIIKLLQSEGFSIRKKKMSIATSGHRQKGTGIILNRKISVGRKEINAIRKFIIDVAKNKDFITSSEINTINGKINFANQISKIQGTKLAIFARKLLVAPVINTSTQNSNEYRKCNRIERNHVYQKAKARSLIG